MLRRAVRVERVTIVPVPPIGTVLDYVASLEPEYCGVQPGTEWTALLAVALYFTTGPQEQKAVNLTGNPWVVLTTGCNGWEGGLDVMVEARHLPER